MISNKFKVDPPDNGSWYPANFVPVCLRIQTFTITEGILLWDVLLIIPNILFNLFLLAKRIQMNRKLNKLSFPIIKVFYQMILTLSLLSITRCLISIFVKPNTFQGQIINKAAWLVIRFSQLGTELSVVFFGIFFAKLESHKSILRIISLTLPISLLYISIQAVLEFLFPDKHYEIVDKTSHYYDLFGLGGMVFWFVSSTIFTFIYFVIYILPFTKLKEKFPIPMNRSFYFYCLILGIVCLFQSIGSFLVYFNVGDNVDGLCILNLTTFIYYTLFGPLVYYVFLRKFFQKEFLLTRQYLINSSSFNSSTSTRQYNSFQANDSGNMDASWNSNEPRTSRRYSVNRDYFLDRSENYEDFDDDTKIIIVNNIN